MCAWGNKRGELAFPLAIIPTLMYTKWVKWRRYFLFFAVATSHSARNIFYVHINPAMSAVEAAFIFTKMKHTINCLTLNKMRLSHSLVRYLSLLLSLSHSPLLQDPHGWNLNFQLRIDSIPCDFAPNLSFFPLLHFLFSLNFFSIPFYRTIFNENHIQRLYGIQTIYIPTVVVVIVIVVVVFSNMEWRMQKKSVNKKKGSTHNNSNGNVKVSLSSVPFVLPHFHSIIVYRSIHTLKCKRNVKYFKYLKEVIRIYQYLKCAWKPKLLFPLHRTNFN